MAPRPVGDALATTPLLAYPNVSAQDAYEHTFHSQVQEAVGGFELTLIDQADATAARFQRYIDALAENTAASDALAEAVRRGDLDATSAAQRVTALDNDRQALLRIVDEKNRDDQFRLQASALRIVEQLEDPVSALDVLQRKYPSLQRNWDH